MFSAHVQLKNGSDFPALTINFQSILQQISLNNRVMANENMPKVNLEKEAVKLSTSDLFWMKKIEKDNLERVKKLKKTRRISNRIGLFCGLFALSIYSYTIYAVKQETYFDDFELPETVKDED